VSKNPDTPRLVFFYVTLPISNAQCFSIFVVFEIHLYTSRITNVGRTINCVINALSLARIFLPFYNCRFISQNQWIISVCIKRGKNKFTTATINSMFVALNLYNFTQNQSRFPWAVVGPFLIVFFHTQEEILNRFKSCFGSKT